MRIGRMFHRKRADPTWCTYSGRGLEGDRYVIEKYRSLADGQIHPIEAEQPGIKGRRSKRRTIMSAGAVKKLRPERDEIIVCTALNLKASGIQYWGIGATGIFAAPLRALSGYPRHAHPERPPGRRHTIASSAIVMPRAPRRGCVPGAAAVRPNPT